MSHHNTAGITGEMRYAWDAGLTCPEDMFLAEFSLFSDKLD